VIDVRDKLMNCFRVVFSNLPESGIPNASVATVAAWDSVAGITLLQVISEEFQIDVDLDQLADLDSFEALAEYLSVTLNR
jgi:acyl carrier protein